MGLKVVSVSGEISPEELGVCDAHSHVWIDSVSGVTEGSPVLNARPAILGELCAFRQAGGDAIADCQPGGCGRNANQLLELSRASQVRIIACTGFHRTLYYPEGHWLWKASSTVIANYVAGELLIGMLEARSKEVTPRAGFIKIACEAELDCTPQAALEAAVAVAVETGSAIEVHTEKGASAEAILDYCLRRNLSPNRIILCHMDKRPDFPLHRELAESGLLLEYDTFYRPKYEPERNLWPLIEKMVDAGLSDYVALATDMAESAMWQYLGGGPGLASFPQSIRSRLRHMGLQESDINGLMGRNIARRLAMPLAT